MEVGQVETQKESSKLYRIVSYRAASCLRGGGAEGGRQRGSASHMGCKNAKMTDDEVSAAECTCACACAIGRVRASAGECGRVRASAGECGRVRASAGECASLVHVRRLVDRAEPRAAIIALALTAPFRRKKQRRGMAGSSATCSWVCLATSRCLQWMINISLLILFAIFFILPSLRPFLCLCICSDRNP
jgi:hypothetical protein